MTDDRRKTKVLVWDLDETLIIFQTLMTGRFDQGAKDPSLAIKLGRRWETLIMQVCDDYFFYEEVENFNEPTLEVWKKYDDSRDLSTYDFTSVEVGEVKDERNNRTLAYRHRRITELYVQGLENLLNEKQIREWQDLYELTDLYTDGWLTAGRTILQRCLETLQSTHREAIENESMDFSSTSSVNVLVTAGCLVPSLVKILLFKLDKFISHENVYSSTEVGKLQCFKWIKQRFNNPIVKFCVIGDGVDEWEAAQALRWPFVKIDGYLRLPALTVQVIDSYMRVIYGDG